MHWPIHCFLNVNRYTEFIYILNRLSLYMDCRASQVAQMVKNLPALWETQVQSLGQKDPLQEGAEICPSTLVSLMLGKDSTVKGKTRQIHF